MNSAVRLIRTIKFGSGVDATIYEEGVLKPPLPQEIIDEMNAGNPFIKPMGDEKPQKIFDYASEMQVKTPDMSHFKTTATSVGKSEVGNRDKPEVEEPKPKLIRRVKLIRRRKKP